MRRSSPMLSTIRAVSPAVGTWDVDPAHSILEFRVRHVGLARVRGTFEAYEGVVVVDDRGAMHASGTIEAASLTTRLAVRDEHLRSADFFDVDHHPHITFVARAMDLTGEDRLRVLGDLTIRGTTRTIELSGELLGIARDDEGAERIGLELAGTLDRRDFGLTWNSAVEGGGVLVGNRVDLRLEISAVHRS
jgi:polyisoprenoid-binding protein YceI